MASIASVLAFFCAHRLSPLVDPFFALMPSSTTSSARQPLTGAFAVAEEIASRDLNNLFMTSCYFADPERYRAFCAMYAVMRLIDDRIDAIPSRQDLSAESRDAEHAVVDAWSQVLEALIAGESPGSEGLIAEHLAACDSDAAAPLAEANAEALRLFPVPVSLWRNFFAAMHSDIDRPRFSTYREFLNYTEGASVAPTTIYLYLIVAQRADPAGSYRPPKGFDLLDCGRQLGTFAYIAHILRDLAKDLQTGEEGLLYLATDDLRRHGLDENDLRQDLERQQAGPRLRALVADLASRSRHHLDLGRGLFAPLEGVLSPDGDFILELIVTIYEEVLAKIVDCSHDPLNDERHRLTFDEKQAISKRVAARFGLEL